MQVGADSQQEFLRFAQAVLLPALREAPPNRPVFAMPDDVRVAPRVVSVERTIPADAERIFDILADPAQHPLIDGSGSVRSASTNNPERLAQGTPFGMRMSLGAGYRIHNVVVEFDEPHRIAWRHFGGHRWRYVLTSVDGGTLVREEWDSTPVPWAYPLLRLLGFPERNRRGMEQTLVRLEQRATDPGAAL